MDEHDQPLGAVETRAAIAEGRLTAAAATERLLERIAALEPSVEAWVAVDAEGARAAARALDAGPARGALHGVGLGVKDIFAAEGLPWRSGSPIWKDRVAEFDAGSVALARGAGGVVIGKTETTEFAGYQPSRTRNPVVPGGTPGGSSSGSAAAVAAGMVPLALGTQTSGSIIRPASFCGVVGYKPSFDSIEPGGVTPLARSLDTVGVFGRSVPDVALCVSALSGLDLRPDETERPARLGLYRSPCWEHASDALRLAWEGFEADLAPQSELTDTPLPPDLDKALAEVPALHGRIMAIEASDALAHEARRFPQLLSESLMAQIAQGRAEGPESRAALRQALQRLRHRARAEIDPGAVWVTPSATGPAPAFEDGTGDPVFNRIWSLLGLPACSVPILADGQGHPIGVQVVGAPDNDAGVLAVAHWLMRVFGKR